MKKLFILIFPLLISLMGNAGCSLNNLYSSAQHFFNRDLKEGSWFCEELDFTIVKANTSTSNSLSIKEIGIGFYGNDLENLYKIYIPNLDNEVVFTTNNGESSSEDLHFLFSYEKGNGLLPNKDFVLKQNENDYEFINCSLPYEIKFDLRINVFAQISIFYLDYKKFEVARFKPNRAEHGRFTNSTWTAEEDFGRLTLSLREDRKFEIVNLDTNEYVLGYYFYYWTRFDIVLTETFTNETIWRDYYFEIHAAKTF
jgi:hypothetical protein